MSPPSSVSKNKQETRVKQVGCREGLTLCSGSYLLNANFLLGLLFSPEDGSDISLKISTDFQRQLSRERDTLPCLPPASCWFLSWFIFQP
jgi:hypothetical protein